mmetsp:Transcript_5369/g.22721  ORF Transcript_5369/g.22721 Transcript_5369/m.22721 type:complete len:320 (-) Transcript_5369:458-1417(-)
MLVPPSISTGTPSSSSAIKTPTCANPRAPPPAKTKPTECRRSERANRDACAGARPCAGARARWWWRCTENASSHARVPVGASSALACSSTSSRCARPTGISSPCAWKPHLNKRACRLRPSSFVGARSSADATSRIVSACRAHCAHQGDGNGSALSKTTSFAASNCASQCAVASLAKGPTPAWPTSANRAALSATRAAQLFRNAAKVAAQNSSSASAAPSETGTTATARGVRGECALRSNDPRTFADLAKRVDAEPLLATPGWSSSFASLPTPTGWLSAVVDDKRRLSPARAPMRQASAANARGADVARDSREDAGIQRS